jgi:hypothetical protein
MDSKFQSKTLNQHTLNQKIQNQEMPNLNQIFDLRGKLSMKQLIEQLKQFNLN